MKYLILSVLFLSVFTFSNCNKNTSDAAGTWEFAITYTPDGGTAWGEEGTGEVLVDGDKVTINVTMKTGETYVREAELDGDKVIIKGSYTQPVASEPTVSEVVTYDGEGTFDGSTLDANGTYTFKIADYQLDEAGNFVLTATKK